jgi:uncharacterized protein YodC (DUF2158 family)
MQKGDVVSLKSGGQEMTVQEVQQDGKVLCLWTYRGKVIREALDPEMLKPVERRETLEDLLRAAGGAPEAEQDEH